MHPRCWHRPFPSSLRMQSIETCSFCAIVDEIMQFTVLDKMLAREMWREKFEWRQVVEVRCESSSYVLIRPRPTEQLATPSRSAIFVLLIDLDEETTRGNGCELKTIFGAMLLWKSEGFGDALHDSLIPARLVPERSEKLCSLCGLFVHDAYQSLVVYRFCFYLWLDFISDSWQKERCRLANHLNLFPIQWALLKCRSLRW